MERRLAAILAVDIVGYSRLMEADESGTFGRLRGRLKGLLEPRIAQHNGRIFKLMGDGILAEFGSVVDAVECAVALQQAMAVSNDDSPADQGIEARMAVNLGDVIVDGEDRQGEGVNVAARLEKLADPGGLVISRAVHEQVRSKLPLTFEDLGEQTLRNIAEPVRVFRVHARRRAGTVGRADGDDLAELRGKMAGSPTRRVRQNLSRDRSEDQRIAAPCELHARRCRHRHSSRRGALAGPPCDAAGFGGVVPSV